MQWICIFLDEHLAESGQQEETAEHLQIWLWDLGVGKLFTFSFVSKDGDIIQENTAGCILQWILTGSVERIFTRVHNKPLQLKFFGK